MKAIAFWSELLFSPEEQKEFTSDSQSDKEGRVARISSSYPVNTRAEMEALIAERGMPNVVAFTSPYVEMIEGRDWTRREREGIPNCSEALLSLFDEARLEIDEGSNPNQAISEIQQDIKAEGYNLFAYRKVNGPIVVSGDLDDLKNLVAGEGFVGRFFPGQTVEQITDMIQTA